MVHLTMVGRVVDGLPLAASFPSQEEEEFSRTLTTYQNQAKQLFRKINPNSPSRCSIETGPYVFHYLLYNDACYLALCDKGFPKRLAFAYLEDISNEFDTLYGAKIHTASRPYAFIEFDTYLQKAKRAIQDGRARRNLSQLNTDLQDVQRIMVQNIDDVLQRGEALSDLHEKALNLSTESEKYKKQAHSLNLSASAVWIGAMLLFVILLVVFIRIYWW